MACRSWLDPVSSRELETLILGCSKYRMTVFTQGSLRIRCKLDQRLIRSSHTSAIASCTGRNRLFFALELGDQNFRC
jgi:hypothetical protein